MRTQLIAASLLVLACAACGSSPPEDTQPLTCEPVAGRPALALEEVGTGFDLPVYVTSPPSDPRLFVLEKGGTVRIIENGATVAEPFLTVTGPGVNSLDDERGLLGLAFHPAYRTNRKLYVFYTDSNSDTVVEEYLADAANPNRADPASATQVFFLEDFAGNHNGGTIQFGRDGYLYIGIGDGGGSNDPMDYGQNLEVAFGKILRLDVDALPYAVPSDNPFVGIAGMDEIWSFGWRNPWRWSFDRTTGDLYVGDVGQGTYEEIDVEARAAGAGGKDYGWSDMEGAHCFGGGDTCPQDGKINPVFEWDHNTGCTAVGGYVYRGCRMPDYHGTYFFADYCGGWVNSFEWDGVDGYDNLLDWPELAGGDIVSFGEDAYGELYIVRQDTGQIMKIVPGA